VIKYREATRDDLRPICVLGQEVNALHHAAWPDVFAPSGDPTRDETLWSDTIAQENATAFVAEAAGEVIGFANISFVRRDPNPLLQPVSFARVGSVAVAERHRGKGIGSQLMRRAEAWAAARGAHHVVLNVWTFNERAVKLYRSLGYEVRAYAMGKRLAG
jgi:ribosomal protein S18 acetylase RimI-like enzyme